MDKSLRGIFPQDAHLCDWAVWHSVLGVVGYRVLPDVHRPAGAGGARNGGDHRAVAAEKKVQVVYIFSLLESDCRQFDLHIFRKCNIYSQNVFLKSLPNISESKADFKNKRNALRFFYSQETICVLFSTCTVHLEMRSSSSTTDFPAAAAENFFRYR